MELGRKGELITHDKDHAVLTLMDIDKVIEDSFVPIYPEMNLGDIVHQAVVKSNRNIFPVIDKEDNTLLGIILLDDIRPIMFDQKLYKEVMAADIMNTPLKLLNWTRIK